MPSASDPSQTPKRTTRTRRSRYGCRNCKLRKLKCDESKPQCKKCVSFGVICNYMSNLPDLEPSIPTTHGAASRVGSGGAPLVMVSQQVSRIRASHHHRQLQTPLRPAISSAVWTSDVSDSYRFHLDARMQNLITCYFGENKVGSYEPNMGGVYRKLLKQAFSYPFLMHAYIAGALAYDRYMQMSSTPDWATSTSGAPRRTIEECYHLSQSTVLLNKHLEGLIFKPSAPSPVSPRERVSGLGIDRDRDSRDPLWGTASLLALLTFSSSSSSRDASTPQESWPLVHTTPVSSPPSSSSLSLSSSPSSTPQVWSAPQEGPSLTMNPPTFIPRGCGPNGSHSRSSPTNNEDHDVNGKEDDANEREFNWSRMTNSKVSLRNFVQPLRQDSIFSVLGPTFADMHVPLPESGIKGIPPPLAKVCNLTPTSTPDTSPYFLAAHAVAHLWGDEPIPMRTSTITTPLNTSNGIGMKRSNSPPKLGTTHVFTRIVNGPYEERLKNRDPVALLLLYLWYTKSRRGVWWIELRARVEVPAICEYLRRYHAGRTDILEFLI